MKTFFAGLFIGLLALATTPASAQDFDSGGALATLGVSSSSSADEIAAAVASIITANPDLSNTDLENLVSSAVALNPSGYADIATAAASAADAQGKNVQTIATIIAAAVNTASSAGVLTDADALATQIASAIGVNSAALQAQVALQTNVTPSEFLDNISDDVAEENPNQDASPS